MSALFNIGYGLYVITCNDGKKDSGMIGNTVAQVANGPRIMVSINKANYSHDVIKETGIMNVNCLSVEAPFSVFQNFGYQSGRDADKFADEFNKSIKFDKLICRRSCKALCKWTGSAHTVCECLHFSESGRVL